MIKDDFESPILDELTSPAEEFPPPDPAAEFRPPDPVREDPPPQGTDHENPPEEEAFTPPGSTRRSPS